MEIRTAIVTVTTTGSAGSATGSATSATMHGELLDVYLDYHASAPATSDVTIAYGAPSLGNIMVRSDSATDGRFAPRSPGHSATAAAITDSNDRYPLNGTLTVSLAQCDALTGALVATIRYLGY